VPCTLSRKLNNEELRSYLDARSQDLGELLLPHADGDLLYLMTANSMDITDAFSDIPPHHKVHIIRLKILLASYAALEAKANQATKKALVTAERNALLAAARPKSGGGPGATVRPWDSIVTISQEKAARNEDKVQAKVDTKRLELETNGAEVCISTPKVQQAHHHWLLDGDEDDIGGRLEGMGFKLLSYESSCGQSTGLLTMHASGQALSEFFKVTDKDRNYGKGSFFKYQDFWGKRIVGKARSAANDKEGELIKKHDQDALEKMSSIDMDRSMASYKSKVLNQEKKVGVLITNVHLAPSEQKHLVEQQEGAERLILEALLREREEKKEAVSALWAGRVMKRAALEAERKRKRDSAHFAIEEGKKRKAAAVDASAAMAAAAVKAANATAVSMASVAAAVAAAAAAAPPETVAAVTAPAPPAAAAAAVNAAPLPAIAAAAAVAAVPPVAIAPPAVATALALCEQLAHALGGAGF